MATIYVALLDEAVEVWRPVEAAHEGEDLYRILSANADPKDEQWEFQQGELVRCRVKTFSGGSFGGALAAYPRCCADVRCRQL